MQYKLWAIAGLWACAAQSAMAQEPAAGVALRNETRSTERAPGNASPGLDDVFTGWKHIASDNSTAVLNWRRVGATMPISRFNAEYTRSPFIEPNGHQLQLDGDHFHFLSQRIVATQIERPEGFQVHREVFNYFPERDIGTFATLLHSRFTLPAPSVVAQPFVRVLQHGQLHDFWGRREELYPRAVNHAAPVYGSDDWALMRIEWEDNDQCASLDLWSALLAWRPSGLAPFVVQRDRCQLDARPVITNGHKCLRVIEQLDPGGPSRVWFVDLQMPHVVRRYIGTAAKEKVQLDLRWSSEEEGFQPLGWQYCRYKGNQAPVQFFGESLVVPEEDAAVQAVVKDGTPFLTVDAASAFNNKTFPIGTWVIDEVNDEQYVMAENGQPRTIAPAELVWLPLHSELMRTSSGKVGELIKSKMVWRKVRRGEWNLPLGIAAVLLLSVAAAGWHRFRQRERLPRSGFRQKSG